MQDDIKFVVEMLTKHKALAIAAEQQNDEYMQSFHLNKVEDYTEQLRDILGTPNAHIKFTFDKSTLN